MPGWGVDIFVKDASGTYQKLNEGVFGAFTEPYSEIGASPQFELHFSVTDETRDLFIHDSFIQDVSFNGKSIEVVTNQFSGNNLSWVRKKSGKSVSAGNKHYFKITFKNESELMETDLYKRRQLKQQTREETGTGAGAARGG